MEQAEFAEFYEHYRDKCVHAGVEPVTPETMQARIAERQLLGLEWDTGPQKTMQ